jgi:MFS family permease
VISCESHHEMLSEICAGITLCRDGKLLFAARAVRMFSFGGITVVLLLFLSEIGFSDAIIGACLTSILAGDLCITLVLTTYADRFGRRRTLVIGGLLKVFAGLVFALSRNVYITVLAGTLGVITPTGGDIGPFLSIETAALTDLLQGGQVATVFGWYQLVGGVTQAFGALAAGWGVSALVSSGMSTLFAFRCVVLGYAVAGCLLTVIYLMLSEAAEARPSATYTHRTILSSFIGLHSNRSRSVVARLSALFALDAFAGGFSMQTFISLWFERRWALDPRHLGSMLMGVNLIAALSGLVVGPLVSRYAAVTTMPCFITP